MKQRHRSDMDNYHGIAKVYRKFNIKKQPNDFTYWQSQSYEKRLAALEEISREYHGWKIILNQDYKKFLQSLNNNNVRYLIVGAYALALHGHPRYTKDIDIWLERSAENASRVVNAHEEFGFGSLGLKSGRFSGI